MKKLIAMLLILISVLVMVGCDNVKQKETIMYSFRGEHDYFAISNGSIVLNDVNEIFDGGDLQITQSDVLNEIASYSTTFYTIIDGERRTILSNSVIDQTGSAINVEGDLGKSSGKGVIIGSKVENIDELKDNLWFELETTDLHGKENVYQIQLTFSN